MTTHRARIAWRTLAAGSLLGLCALAGLSPLAARAQTAAQTGTARTDAQTSTLDRPRTARQEVVQLDRLITMAVSPGRDPMYYDGLNPNVREPSAGGYAPRACNQLATHTDASFEGGSYVMQAGFAENELFAATYTLQPSDFPIKIDRSEIIFATRNATTSTTTVWTISYYSGTPTNGQLVARFDSNGEDLPHINMGPGTNGTNVQFSIDSSDPDQIVINNNGSNKFTVAWGVFEHNNQDSNPCLTGPNTCCNAFPVTDISGLSRPQDNWLFGVNCGGFGCPPNGGWSTFANLNQLCRPTGDVVTRTAWTSLSCTPGVGACCLPDGTCDVRTVTECQAAGGTFRGDGTSCAGNPCGSLAGACCFGTFCLSLTNVDCVGAGGNWQGANSTCTNGNACPTGACCLPDGSCIPGVTSAQCALQGGAFRGVNTTCASPCPQPVGACCLPNGFCLSTTLSNCNGIGGSFGGAASTCADVNGNGVADSCEACNADFNRDGDVGTDGDIEAFFSCLAGNCCPTCGSADFNADGDVGTDADIEAFFRVLAGGAC